MPPKESWPGGFLTPQPALASSSGVSGTLPGDRRLVCAFVFRRRSQTRWGLFKPSGAHVCLHVCDFTLCKVCSHHPHGSPVGFSPPPLFSEVATALR